MTATIRLFSAVVGALVLSAGAAQAQPSGPNASGAQQPDLSSVLHLRPDQQAAYARYKAGTRPSQGEINQIRMSRQGLTSLPTPARLDKIAAVLRLQMDIFQHNADATRAFYSQLSPDQQHTFDQVTAPPAQRGRPQG